MADYTTNQQEIVDIFILASNDLQRTPSTTDLEDYQVTRSMLRTRFGGYRQLVKAMRASHRELFKDVNLSDLTTAENNRVLLEAVKSTRRFVITTAVVGCVVDAHFLAAIDQYCEMNNAELLIMIAADPAHQYDQDLGVIDKVLENRQLVLAEVALNNNLYLSAIKLSAKQIDPITGMQQLAQDAGSYIFASPKQRLKFVPTSMDRHPPAIMGTGAITQANYTTNMYMSRRTGYLATRAHKLGAIIVEIEDADIFHFRQIQAGTDGSFVDWGIRYGGRKTRKARVEALVCGDLHAGQADEQVLSARAQLIAERAPRRIVLHDAFNGRSISHHVANRTITRAQQAAIGDTNLRLELEALARILAEYRRLCSDLVVVKSNHDEHLVRYLEDGRFLQDPHNYRLALELAAAVYDGKDPIKVGVEIVTGQNYGDVTWLCRDESYVVSGIELGHHGDRGPNGSRGSIKNLANTLQKSVTGHTHSAEIYGEAWRVGTSTGHLDYCSGTSSWTNSDCLVYADGSRQLVQYIDGKFRL